MGEVHLTQHRLLDNRGAVADILAPSAYKLFGRTSASSPCDAKFQRWVPNKPMVARGIFVWDRDHYARDVMTRLELLGTGGGVRIGLCGHTSTDMNGPSMGSPIWPEPA
ncbi:MAG: hypothetical protein ACR2L4_06735 [Actinomycetota bacterium]